MTVHVGLIGAGNISDTHARALRAMSGVEIAAVYAPKSKFKVYWALILAAPEEPRG